MSASSPPRQQPDDPLAVLHRDLSIRLVNGSASGCLLETPSPMEVGTIGSLRVTWQGEVRIEDVRVVRCHRVPGGSRYHVGVQFLGTARTALSLRRALWRAADTLPTDAPRPM
jgi:hypothetical protein